jgi:pilus assembly protein CpaE
VGGRVLVVYSPKGGTGCTVLASNLAVALQNAETSVVIVDANLQFGDVGVCLNLQGKYSLVALAERSDELDEEFLQSVLVPHSSGVKVLLAPPTPEDAELVTPDRLKRVVHRLTDLFHYVVVDTSSALRDVELAAFDSADRLLLVATPDIPTLANIKKFFDLVEKLEYPAEKILLVLNRVDRRSGITAANVEETLKHSVRGQVALDEKTVLASINSGVPFVAGQKSLAPVPGVLDLARLVRDEFAPKETPTDDKARKPATRMAGLFQRR